MKDTSQNRIKLSQLQILVAVANRQNFSEAALDLDISQSAVSHAIASLEQYLGVVLFSRGRYGARLTPAGDRILPHAVAIVEKTQAILNEASITKGLEQGEVRVATFRSIATHVLPKVIAQFHQRFPDIKLNLAEYDDYVQVEQALRDGRIDVGITVMSEAKGITAWDLLEDEFLVLLPPTVKFTQATLTWDALIQQPLIMPPTDYIMMRPVYNHINALGYRLNVVTEVETDATIVSLVAQGVGGTILPRLAAEPIPTSVNVYSLPIPLTRRIGAAVSSQALHPPAVYALLETLMELNIHDATSTKPSPKFIEKN